MRGHSDMECLCSGSPTLQPKYRPCPQKDCMGRTTKQKTLPYRTRVLCACWNEFLSFQLTTTSSLVMPFQAQSTRYAGDSLECPEGKSWVADADVDDMWALSLPICLSAERLVRIENCMKNRIIIMLRPLQFSTRVCLVVQGQTRSVNPCYQIIACDFGQLNRDIATVNYCNGG